MWSLLVDMEEYRHWYKNIYANVNSGSREETVFKCFVVDIIQIFHLDIDL